VYALNGTVEDCIVSNNVAWDAGGGLWLGNGARVRNTLIAHNSAVNDGGGVYVHSSGGIVENCTVADNRAAQGGGISAAGGAVFVQNSIVYYNSAPAGPDWATPGATGIAAGGGVEFTCSPEDLSDWGNGNVNGSPAFRDHAGGDYDLSLSSAAYNAGTNAAWIKPGITRDLNGRDRIIFGRVDMGAYESSARPGSRFFIGTRRPLIPRRGPAGPARESP
jgi:parallel beta-helix repeat protein